MEFKILNKLKKKNPHRLLPSAEAYKLWATFYDNQPLNVVLHLEEELFSEMISEVNIKDKKILDIGCGTGRHWNELYFKKPAQLSGVDSSKEMLNKLKKKFPEGDVHLTAVNSLNIFEDNSFDVIISTLTIGHINDLENYFSEWDRVLKPKGEILITDFHPSAFSIGMKRTFSIDGEVIEVENYLYEIDFLKKIFDKLNWNLIAVSEKRIDEKVKFFFEKQNYLEAYRKFEGTPLIVGIRLTKNDS